MSLNQITYFNKNKDHRSSACNKSNLNGYLKEDNVNCISKPVYEIELTFIDKSLTIDKVLVFRVTSNKHSTTSSKKSIYRDVNYKTNISSHAESILIM